jgi:OOP family OmpA-OmpF porin
VVSWQAQLSTRIVGSPLAVVNVARRSSPRQTPIVFVSDDPRSPLIPRSSMRSPRRRCAARAPLSEIARTPTTSALRSESGRSSVAAGGVERLAKAGVDAFRISAVGYGGERPIASNDSDENRARNRRVEIVVK